MMASQSLESFTQKTFRYLEIISYHSKVQDFYCISQKKYSDSVIYCWISFCCLQGIFTLETILGTLYIYIAVFLEKITKENQDNLQEINGTYKII